jgi:hypothetical protein
MRSPAIPCLTLLLTIAAMPAAVAARAAVAPAIAAEMDGSVRQALLARCGADRRCAAFVRQEGQEPTVRIAGLTCRESRRKSVRTRRCAFTASSTARTDRLSCNAEFHKGPSSTLWSDRRLVKQVRVYLPTSRMNAPVTLGPSTLSCSGSVIDYVSAGTL